MSFRLEDLTGHVRKVAQCRGSWEHGRKFSPPPTHTQRGSGGRERHTHRGGAEEGREREKNDEKPVVNKYWLLRLTGNVTDLCTPSEILADLQKIKESTFITHREAHMEKWKTLHHLTSACPLLTTDKYCVQKS